MSQAAPLMLVAVTTGMREAKSPSIINCYSFTCAIIFAPTECLAESFISLEIVKVRKEDHSRE
jgi:hypothetical protein